MTPVIARIPFTSKNTIQTLRNYFYFSIDHQYVLLYFYVAFCLAERKESARTEPKRLESGFECVESRKIRTSVSFLRLVYLPLSHQLLSGRFGPARLDLPKPQPDDDN